MYYYYDYSYLKEKISSHYRQNTLLQNMNLLSKDLHINIFRIRMIFSNKAVFSQYEISTMILIFELSGNEINKCFNSIIDEFRFKKDLLRYIADKEQVKEQK